MATHDPAHAARELAEAIYQRADGGDLYVSDYDEIPFLPNAYTLDVTVDGKLYRATLQLEPRTEEAP